MHVSLLCVGIMRWRMTFHEVRREIREQSGDGQLKGQRKRLHRRVL